MTRTDTSNGALTRSGSRAVASARCGRALTRAAALMPRRWRDAGPASRCPFLPAGMASGGSVRPLGLQLGREHHRSVWIEPIQVLWCHLECVRGLRWRPDDEPELVALGVVEQLPDLCGVDQQAAERLERVKLFADAHPAGAFEQHVELVRMPVAMARGRLTGVQP